MGEKDLRTLVEELLRRVDAQDETIAGQDVRLAEQEGVIERQQAELEELRSRLKKDSRNSSRPPSSDAPWSKRRRDRKPRSGKKQGGQPGHKGRTRHTGPGQSRRS